MVNQGGDLIRTMDFAPNGGIAALEEHLAQLSAGAIARGFPFDRHGARNELQAAIFGLRGAHIVRLALSASGAIAIESRPADPIGQRGFT